MSKKNRVLYLISRENILEPGVLKSQVLDLVGEILRQDSSTQVWVLNLPSINRFFMYIRNFREVKDYCRGLGIKLIIFPVLPIGRSVLPFWAIPFLLIQAIPITVFFMVLNQINIIHARAYLSALTARFIKLIWIKVGFIFDMRGPYLQEAMLSHARWRKGDFNYFIWGKLEKMLFSNADVVVAQSSGLVDYVKRISSSAEAVLIPTCVDGRKFKISSAERESGRRELNIDDKFVVVYSGSLGSFHEPGNLARAYGNIRTHLPKPHFLVATHSDHYPLSSALGGLGIPGEEISILKNPDLGKTLPLGDVGLHIMGDLPITPTAVAVKFGEYTASGLPVVVSKNMVSATKLVEISHCGVVVDPFDSKDIRVKMQKLVREREIMRRNALKLAKDYFSVKVCAKKYLEIYDELASKNKS